MKIYIQNVICCMQYSFFHSLIPTALGSKSTVGEFFNPGVSCSDILNKNEDSKDGFYWISLAGSDPTKVRASLLGCFFFHKSFFTMSPYIYSSVDRPTFMVKHL